MQRLVLLFLIATFSFTSLPADETSGSATVLSFGNAGKFNMLYDARQRPQSILFGDRLFIVYNGDAIPSSNGKGRAHPMLITYDVNRRTFSTPQRLGPNSTDHHYSPIIWADKDNHLHVLFGCHKTPGTHLISASPLGEHVTEITWEEGPQIAPRLSYPTVLQIAGGRQLIYYRTDGHTSSWTYRVSDDNGHTWSGPSNDITDLDLKGRLDWSSYHTKTIGRDGKLLHVVYTDYDDNKHSPDPKRFYNPRYNTEVSNEWKYNLSYLKIDVDRNLVFNADGERLRTPIDIDYSKQHCEIWDTQWRGAGVPPAVSLNRNGEPTFLHVLSEDNLKSHRYYYVRRKGERWLKTPICFSSHQWNSCHLKHSADGTVHAFVVTGDRYLEGGYMDQHGGGIVEEWVSQGDGQSWQKRRVLSPGDSSHEGWRFNNVQPVLRPDGSEVDGMLLFYGWKDEEAPDAKAFLVHE